MRSNMPQIASKCALIVGRRSPNLEHAVLDPNHRVAANAIRGPGLIESNKYDERLDRLLASPDPLSRRAALWVIRMSTRTDSVGRIKTLIRDHDAQVRRAAFQLPGQLRERLSATAGSMPNHSATEVPASA